MAQSLHISSIGEGTPIVLLHGWGLNSAVFKPLAEALSADYQVLSVDLPGYGYAKVPLETKNHWQALLGKYLSERALANLSILHHASVGSEVRCTSSGKLLSHALLQLFCLESNFS